MLTSAQKEISLYSIYAKFQLKIFLTLLTVTVFSLCHLFVLAGPCSLLISCASSNWPTHLKFYPWMLCNVSYFLKLSFRPFRFHIDIVLVPPFSLQHPPLINSCNSPNLPISLNCSVFYAMYPSLQFHSNLKFTSHTATSWHYLQLVRIW